ncbi:alpha/beta-hydrolase [Rhizodiscina lignyota]|uniref:Alpha/beta-hydrolase n=1 Tax=Rhizodiscina lignyota TaxID=1504668 RepID=A0A9P4I4Y8_9PEZI|nr:alpha/beta-hydrolase [Rhizodiscina lignyota]
MVLNTITVVAAITPTVVGTGFSHYLNRKPLKQKPTAHISYHEGLSLVRQFITYASHHTVEEIQAFTSQWVPVPRWVKLKEVDIGADLLKQSAKHIQAQLGPHGIQAVGGKEWWQWRSGPASLRAEWIEMRSDYQERKRSGDKGSRVLLYVHGGAYYFGSVDEHRYQMQRHARKLKARCLAPRYRLAPQFPFPCGLQDCLAAYLYLLQEYDPANILLAGDSAGGGMTLSMLVIIRDQGIPLPAGAMLLSPWVDLTHSFPSLSGDGAFDYIPAHGFHHRPSRGWPPPNSDELASAQNTHVDQAQLETKSDFTPDLSITIDGEKIEIKEQIQMYAPNHLLTHPLVSPILNPSLGGLPPLLIQAGGGELLCDEQIYLAHKAANPLAYLPSEAMLVLTDPDGTKRKRYEPTDVQLQVWDDLCHVAHTLSWTRPAKYMYRAVAQFGAWALARAQHRTIDILDDDDISEISTETSTESTDSESGSNPKRKGQKMNGALLPLFNSVSAGRAVGKAGDPLPPFENNMIRQRIDRHGDCYDLPPASEIRALQLAADEIGTIKEGPVRKWLKAQKQWDDLYANRKRNLQRQTLEEMKGYLRCGDGTEKPPPTALVGRRRLDENGQEIVERKRFKRSWGMSLWSLWGSKHDEKTVKTVQFHVKSVALIIPTRSNARNVPVQFLNPRVPKGPGESTRNTQGLMKDLALLHNTRLITLK